MQTEQGIQNQEQLEELQKHWMSKLKTWWNNGKEGKEMQNARHMERDSEGQWLIETIFSEAVLKPIKKELEGAATPEINQKQSNSGMKGTGTMMENIKDKDMYNLRTFTKMLSEIDISAVKKLDLVPNSLGEPSVMVSMNQELELYFPIVSGFQIHYINEWLRSFVGDMVIEFCSYCQYAGLLERVNDKQFRKVGVVNG